MDDDDDDGPDPEAGIESGSRVLFGSFLKTLENRESLEKYLGGFFFRMNSSSSVTELGREESQQGSPAERRARSAANEEDEVESVEAELPVESREAVVVVSVEEDEVEEEASRRVRTMEIRGERWSGKSWPL
ncbi:hypothetical protein Ancab_013383 [Ancistrocladus abbreviatus]